MDTVNRLFSVKIVLLFFSLMTLATVGCAKPRQGPSLPDVAIGVAEFTQPKSTAEMLAGFMAEDAPRISMKELTELDEAFMRVLDKDTQRTYIGGDAYIECRNSLPPGQAQDRVGALQRWVSVGNCMKVDFLLVPQVYALQEREGGEAGVTRPAGVVMDIFLIDVTNQLLTSRSHFDEVQTPLSENLLEAGKFFSRGGRWISASELASEGMEKAAKDLGL